MLYFDTNYVVRLYTRDAGWEKVRALAATDGLASCLHGRAETVAAAHRKFREGSISRRDLDELLKQFETDCRSGGFNWLPLSPVVVERVIGTCSSLPATVHLRAGDALHLACAAENGHQRVYSNDTRFLAAAVHFGLTAVNII